MIRLCQPLSRLLTLLYRCMAIVASTVLVINAITPTTNFSKDCSSISTPLNISKFRLIHTVSCSIARRYYGHQRWILMWYKSEGGLLTLYNDVMISWLTDMSMIEAVIITCTTVREQRVLLCCTSISKSTVTALVVYWLIQSQCISHMA